MTESRPRGRATVVEPGPLPVSRAVPALVRCVMETALLEARWQVHLPNQHVGWLHFRDGAAAPGLRRDEYLADPLRLDPAVTCGNCEWWRLVAVEDLPA